MSSAPYFFSDTLRARFTQDIQDAIGQSRISRDDGAWLQLLAAESTEPANDAVPRVDRLLINDQLPVNAELAAALFISDATNPSARVFLSTLTFGIEQFESRSALFNALQQRFDDITALSIVESERIEGSLFEACTQTVMRQQAGHLQRLAVRLEALPDLREATGKAFQDVLVERGIDVVAQTVQLVHTAPGATPATSTVVGTQYLADAAMQAFSYEALPQGQTRRYLDAKGAALPEAQAIVFDQALADSAASVGTAYAQLLSDYWTSQGQGGRTRRDLTADALAECFRQHLLSGRAHRNMTEAEYRCLLTLLPSPPGAPAAPVPRVRRLSVVVAGQDPVKLVGVFLIDFPGEASPAVFLYSSLPGFLRFSDQAQAIEHVLRGPSRAGLLFYSSLNDHSVISLEGQLELHHDTLTEDFFSEFIDAMIALQERDLRYVLDLPALHSEKNPARIDDALDIRKLLDGRLLNIHGSGRWRQDRLSFDSVWGAAAQSSVSERPNLISYPSYNWMGKLKKLDALLGSVDAMHPGADGCMHRALNLYLALAGGPPLDARKLWVQADVAEAAPVPVLALALDRVCGYASAPLADSIVLAGQITPVAGQPVQRLPLALLEQILICVQADFAQRFEGQISEFYSRTVRQRDTSLHPGVIAALVREYSLRLELLVERRTATLPVAFLDNVQQVLDRPLPALRESLGEARVDAFAVTVEYDPQAPVVKVPNAFVVTGRLPDSKPILWILDQGLVGFETRQLLEEYVAGRLTSMELGSQVSGVIAEPDRRMLLSQRSRRGTLELKVVLQPIEGHLIEALQRDEVERQQRTVADLYRQSIAWQVPSELFVNLLSAAERDDRNRQALNSLGVAIQFIIYRALVPSWVSEASKRDQVMLVEVLRRFYVTCVGEKDFLFDIPSFYDYSLEQLKRRFDNDFAEPRPDPENVRVSLTHYVPAPVAPGELPQSIPAATQAVSENLVEFAINRFLSRQDGVILLSSTDDTPLNAALTPAYLRELVRSLDIAASYRTMLNSVLAETTPEYLERRKLFVEQVPSLDILRAFAFKLKNELSEQAYRIIENVLTMPDAVARLPVDGCQMILSPLKLLPAKEGWEPTVVLNTYLMGPKDNQPGPWVLYAPLNNDFVFKEYADQAALVLDIQTSAYFQAYILDRIDPDLRKIYDKGGFVEPHLPFSTESSFDLPFERPAPVTVQIDPYEGNCLLLMFKGALDILKLQVKQYSVTNAEHRRAATQYLFTLGAEQFMALMPGRLGALIGIIQGQTLLNLSLISATDQQWGQAISEFMAALSVMISSGQNPAEAASLTARETSALVDDATSSDPLVQLIDGADTFEFSWSNGSLTQQIRERLREFEVHDIALYTLQRDELLSVYRDPVTSRAYAAIGGKTYEVQSDEDGWFIVSGSNIGPSVSLDADQQWKLDIQGGLRGGGGALTRMEGSLVDDLVDEIMVVSARGMPEIRHRHRDMAQAIEDACLQAQRYLENALDNLTRRLPDNKLDPRAEKILGDFFAQKVPDDRLRDVTKKAVTDLYQELIDPSMSPIDSSRYVIGVNRIGNESASAFIFEADPARRIFLTEQFFRLPTYRLKLSAQRSGEFKFAQHYRGAILIHELSHMVLKTDDMAYVDSQAPFIDLLEDAPAYRLRIRNETVYQQQKTLSFHTDRDKLFKQLDEDVWRDLRRRDGNGKQTVLRIAGKSTLEEARDVFYEDVHKRTDIMLKNADSVALLVTLLGRERFVKR
ncbi:dermonecrotic toxin domain-containing protein [Pseudomonas syringae]|uniref:dermonecrotic toxin domain-containing protein n=2 Tax=Pseudomonas syringae TaxID=317 RepID=UPI001F39BA92|nr:DUF6543 domain-containing protein [Pseudomonas syringae]MCF5470016.1 hypothetical protein [Pseudomonas syringae]MCF5471945.1 hypothetical protein [Pseudomonas syringae]MCF5482078.1 hypothetical protein [Pseudomonas syringae]MCF5487128.1 hypothetical protein [Pseudomonas syringae]MCF5490967.1 hypothetical protein [Pseudomonas syringae]